MEQRVTKEECYERWIELRPMWKKWAGQMAKVGFAKEDWAQESYMILVEAMSTYDEKYGISFNAYYRMLLYRYGKRMINKPQHLLMYGGDKEDNVKEVEDETVTVEKEYVQKERQEEVRCLLEYALGELKMGDRKLIENLYFRGKSIAQLAVENQVSYDAIECKKRRLLKKLKKYLEKSNGIKRSYPI